MNYAKRRLEINESATQRREACLEYWTHSEVKEIKIRILMNNEDPMHIRTINDE